VLTHVPARARGLAAKEQLRALLGSGDVTFQPAGHDRYGRTLARVYAGKVDVGQQLIREGHALPYIPGPTPSMIVERRARSEGLGKRQDGVLGFGLSDSGRPVEARVAPS
jgi:endonuclease YncB( thermonuclease family)